jgi:hypothetical protein
MSRSSRRARGRDLRHDMQPEPEALAAVANVAPEERFEKLFHGRRGVDRSEIDPRYLIRPYLVPDGKVGHDAFAGIRETIREMNKVAIGRVVLTNREHIIALDPMGKGLMRTLLRYPYEVRSADEYFDDIQDVKVTKDMLDLARHIVNQKAGPLRTGQVRRPVRNRSRRSHQPEARRQAHYRERAAAWGERRRFDGRAAQEHRRRGAGKVLQAGQEATQGPKRPEGNADADRRQETGEGSCGKEAGCKAAAEVGLADRETSGHAGRPLLRRSRQAVADG